MRRSGIDGIGLSRKQIWGRAKISSNTFLYKSENFKAMPRKKVKAHKKTSAYKVFRLIDRNNFEYERNFRKSHLQKIWNWTHFLYNVLHDRPHLNTDFWVDSDFSATHPVRLHKPRAMSTLSAQVGKLRHEQQQAKAVAKDKVVQ